MHIVVFGSGGVGAGLGCHLARNGGAITFIARGEHLRAMKQHGLRVRSAQGDFVIDPVQATDDPKAIKNADVILLCVKTWQLDSVIDDLKSLIGPDTFVVPLLNSIEATDILVSKLGAHPVLGGICYTVSYIVEPGIVHSGGPQRIVFGELDHRPSDRSQALADIINATGVLVAENSLNIQERMWEKFTWISSASAVGSVTRVTAAQWKNVPETKSLFQTVLHEAFAVAKARGVTLGDDKVKGILDYLDRLPDSFKSSMQRDIEAGKPSELLHQIGYIVREGQRLGVPVPNSAAIFAALLPQELVVQRLNQSQGPG